MNPYLEITRPLSSILAGLAVIAGLIISDAPFSILFLYAFLAVFFISAAGMVINDYYDLKIDKINAPKRPLPSGRMSERAALFYTIFLFMAGLFFSALLNVYCFSLALFNVLLEIFYSRNFKKYFLIGNVIVSWMAASTFLFGALLTFNFRIVGILALLTFLVTMGREIFKSIKDLKGDRKMKLDTLPVAVGVDSAKKIAQGFIAAAVLLFPLPYFLGHLNIIYLKTASIAAVLFLYSLSQKPAKTVKIAMLAMFISLLAFLLGKCY